MADSKQSEATTQSIPTEKMTTEASDKPLAQPKAEEKQADGSKVVMRPGGVPKTGFEEGFYKHFMNPMLSQMEENVKKNTQMLDEFNRKLEQERIENRKKLLSKHIPGPLQGNGQQLSTIMKHIQDLIMYEDFDDNEKDTSKFVQARLKELDENVEVAILSHSIAAYVSTLDPTHLRQFTNRIVSDTTLWVSRLFRFNESSAYFHEEAREGLVRVCRLALHKKYPKYASDGYEALYSRTPIIYMSSAAQPGLGQYICTQLGLPISCLSNVPCNTLFGSQHKMDIATLEKLIQDDLTSGKMPVMLVAYAGTPLVGHVDNVQRLQEICKKHDIWLHIEGTNLATLTLYSVPTSIIPAQSGDSMSLNMGGWLGLPAVPHVTLYKSTDPTLAHAAGLMAFNSAYKLNCLPLWLCLQNLGHEGVVKTVQHSINLAKQLSDKILGISTLKNVSKNKKPVESPKPAGLRDLFNKAICALVIFEIENPTVVFRYKGPATEEQSSDTTKQTEAEAQMNDIPAELDPYFDALNIWLAEMMRREVPKVHVSAVDVDGEGVCIRFSPLESAHMFDTKAEDIDTFLECLDWQLQILNSTVSQRKEFQEIVEAQDNLRLVTLPNWAGLGAIQFIPDSWREVVDNLPDAGRKEIDHLNSSLVQQLKCSDTAFSLGTTRDSLSCVRFGLITDDTDLEELIGLVYSTGREIEDSSKFLETMADIVKQGIEKANEDLVKENENKLMQEGVLRQVPVVGSLLNWWSPPSKDITAKGRTFNLESGSIASTESTYKHHMQVQETTPQLSPQPKEASFKNSLKKPKRHSSGSSVTSGSGIASPKSLGSSEELAKPLVNGIIENTTEAAELQKELKKAPRENDQNLEVAQEATEVNGDVEPINTQTPGENAVEEPGTVDLK